MAPVMEHLIALEDLYNGKYNLADIALLNEGLAIRNENQRRATEAAENERQA